MPTNAASAAVLAIPIILGGEIGGALFEGDCNDPGALVRIPALPKLVESRVRPIVLSAGNILGPEPLSSLALEAPVEVSEELLSLLKRDNGRPVFDGVLPGEFELSADPATLARLNFDGRIPWTVANIPLRAQHRRYRVFLRQGIRIGLTAVIDEALLPLVDPSHNHGAIESAAHSLSRSAQILRQAGAHVVVAMLHTQRANGLSRVLQLLESAQVALPDVVLTSALDTDPTSIHLDGLRTVVVSAPKNITEAAVIWLGVSKDRTLTKIEAERLPVEATPSGLADIIRNWACKRLDIPLFSAEWAEPIPRGLFRQFVLERMRQLASAEVAIISKQTLGSAAAFPLPKSPTQLHLRAALPFDDGLQVARIRGSVLARLESLVNDVRVHVHGLSSERVAGRPRDPRRIYKVVTVDFLADGGDAVIDPARYNFHPLRSAPSLRDMVADTLRIKGFQPDADPDPDHRIEEPGLFDIRVNLGASIKSVNVENGSGAEAPQLVRENFLGLTGDLEARLTLDLPRHRFELSNLTRFGVVRETIEDADGSERSRTRENEDVTRVEGVYNGRLSGGQDRPWLPDASAIVSLETELTRPADERSYRRALLQIGLGPAWQLAGNLSLRAQLGLRRELFAPSATSEPDEISLAETKIASLFGAELRDEVFESYAARPVTLNVRLDYTADLSGRVRDQVFQGRTSVDVPITHTIALTAALDVYLLSRNQRRGASLSGGALDTSFGIKSSADFSQLLR
ncbi:MAG: bifunctional metallophosphatase/5'-nucleotidase [Myxococcales bacterium]|nr:bifunctional metallophosphatase/5'-nucleotidase [Myxococcales bacterium]